MPASANYHLPVHIPVEKTKADLARMKSEEVLFIFLGRMFFSFWFGCVSYAWRFRSRWWGQLAVWAFNWIPLTRFSFRVQGQGFELFLSFRFSHGLEICAG